MFSENEKISGRQLYRTIVVTLVGPTLLLGPRIVAKFGADGFLVYGLAGIFSVIYVALMMFIRQCVFEKKVFANGLICSSKCMAGKALLNVLLSAKLFILSVLGLYLICDVVTGILLPTTHILLILLVLMLGLVYWNQGGIESSARAFEVLFYWVLIPVVIVVGLAVPKIEISNLKPMMETSVADIVKAALLIWFLFTPAELLVLCGKHFRNDKKTRNGIWKGVLLLFAGNVVTYGTILGIYGGVGIVEGSPYPLLKMMQISGVPGDFIRRVDGFMSVFLILSLFCEIVLLMDYMGISIWQIMNLLFGKEKRNASNHNVNNRKTKGNFVNKSSKKKVIFSCLLAVVMVISVIILREYIPLNQPATGRAVVNQEKKVISSVEIEDRAFVMSIIIGEKTVTFEIASSDKDKWQEESVYVTLQSGIVEEAEAMYKDNGTKQIDFSHIKMVFIEEDIYDSKITLYNLKYMYEQERFAENILVCPLKGDLVEMAAKAMKEEKAFAVNVEKIMENSEKSKGMELYNLFK